MLRLISALAISIAGAVSPVFSAQGDHLVISNLTVPNASRLEANRPYQASLDIRTTGAPVAIQQLCFFWNTDGPYCFRQFKMKNGPDGGVHPTILLLTGNPGKYRLRAVMTYRIEGRTYETNPSSTTITVR